jgi:hypothetical protein
VTRVRWCRLVPCRIDVQDKGFVSVDDFVRLVAVDSSVADGATASWRRALTVRCAVTAAFLPPRASVRLACDGDGRVCCCVLCAQEVGCKDARYPAANSPVMGPECFDYVDFLIILADERHHEAKVWLVDAVVLEPCPCSVFLCVRESVCVFERSSRVVAHTRLSSARYHPRPATRALRTRLLSTRTTAARRSRRGLCLFAAHSPSPSLRHDCPAPPYQQPTLQLT